MHRLTLGTRGSKLALAQAHETRRRLAEAHGFAEAEIAIEVISTTGDREQGRPLAEIGGKGLFTKEIEEALLEGRIDIAVHSMKDVPTVLPDGLVIPCYLPREDSRDALLSPVAESLKGLPHGARVGTSSIRRAAQLRALRPDVEIVPFRGNVETRLRKLDEGQVQATFLACAGLERLGLADRITSRLSSDEMLPAVAQGAIGLEIRARDSATKQLLQKINHGPTEAAIECERAFLAVLDGSCRTPIAGHAYVAGPNIAFSGEALTPDGVHVFRAKRFGTRADPAALGRDAGEEVKARGGSVLTQ